MSQTADTMTVYFIQEQGSMGAWDSIGLGYKDEGKAGEHVNKMTAVKLLDDLSGEELTRLFNEFDKKAGETFANLTSKKARVAALLALEISNPGALHYGAEEIADQCGGYYSYEDCSITL